MSSIDTDGKRIFIAATSVSFLSTILGISSVFYYLFEKPDCISAPLVTLYSCVALPTLFMLILMTVASTVETCKNGTTSMISSVLSTGMLAGLCAVAGYTAHEVEDECSGDSSGLGLTISASASAGIGFFLFVYLWASNTGNIEASFGDLRPRYRRARQFV